MSSLIAVIPSTAKVDVDKIRKDIPKYYPYLKLQSKSDWDQFLNDQFAVLTNEGCPSQYQAQLRQLVKAGANRTVAALPPPQVADEIESEPVQKEVCPKTQIMIIMLLTIIISSCMQLIFLQASIIIIYLANWWI